MMVFHKALFLTKKPILLKIKCYNMLMLMEFTSLHMFLIILRQIASRLIYSAS